LPENWIKILENSRNHLISTIDKLYNRISPKGENIYFLKEIDLNSSIKNSNLKSFLTLYYQYRKSNIELVIAAAKNRISFGNTSMQKIFECLEKMENIFEDFYKKNNS